MSLVVLLLFHIINIIQLSGQSIDIVYPPEYCNVWIYRPQSTEKAVIGWSQVTLNTEYYLFSKNLEGEDQSYHIVPPIVVWSESEYYAGVQSAYISILQPMDPYSTIWMMAYYPSEDCLYPGQNNCPYSITNTTCVIHYDDTSPTSAPTTPNIISPSSTSGSITYYYSSGTDYQHGYITCPTYYCYIYCNSADHACDDLVIDATAATYLRLYCRTYEWVCNGVQVIEPPRYAAYIYCETVAACVGADMALQSIITAQIICTASSTPNGWGPCANMVLQLEETTTVTIDCDTYRSCPDDMYIDNVDSFTLNAKYDGASSGATIYAENMDSSASMIINCDVYGACGGTMTIYASDSNGPNLELNCANDTACASINIFIDNIVWDKLQLTCSTNAACDQIEFYCQDSFFPDDSTYWPSFRGLLLYNATHDEVSCFGADDDGCCPTNLKWGPTFLDITGSGSISYDCVGTHQCEAAKLIFSNYGMSYPLSARIAIMALCEDTKCIMHIFI